MTALWVWDLEPLKNDAWRNRSLDRFGSIWEALRPENLAVLSQDSCTWARLWVPKPYHEGVDQPVNLVLCSVFDARGAMASEPTDSEIQDLAFCPAVTQHVEASFKCFRWKLKLWPWFCWCFLHCEIREDTFPKPKVLDAEEKTSRPLSKFYFFSSGWNPGRDLQKWMALRLKPRLLQLLKWDGQDHGFELEISGEYGRCSRSLY